MVRSNSQALTVFQGGNDRKLWILGIKDHVVVVQLLSCVQLFVTPWTATRQASLSVTISRSLLKLMSIE